MKKYVGMLFFGMALLSLGSALAQGAVPGAPREIGWVDLRSLLTPEIWAGLVFFLAGHLTGPLTTLFKKVFRTHGTDSKRLNLLLVAVLTGIFPFFTGVYGYTVLGFIYALVVTLLRSVVDQASYDRDILVSQRGGRVVAEQVASGLPEHGIVDSKLPNAGERL